MDHSSSSLAAMLRVDRDGEWSFSGPSQWMPVGRVFGGQVLGQAVAAAQLSVPPDRPIHSVHAYFLRPGDSTRRITYDVESNHDGGTFSARRTQASQEGVPILSMTASFHRVEPGLDQHEAAPVDLPAPDDLPSNVGSTMPADELLAQAHQAKRTFDIRHIPTEALTVPGVANAFWMRAIDPLPDDPQLHRAGLAFASDFWHVEPILRRRGLPPDWEGVWSVSLDHAVWFHRPARVDEWLLCTQHSPNAVAARDLSFGRIFTSDGALVATVAQEALIRDPDARA